MLDHRVYRAAFLPALVALFVVAFSLSDRPGARTTRLAPLAFDATRAFGPANPPPRNSVRELAEAFPHRPAGGPADARLADRVAEQFLTTGFAGPSRIRRERFGGDTPDGGADLDTVVATREGLSSRAIVIAAHRDARRGPAAAELSGTAAVMELARLLADRDLAKTVVLASVSGGSGGFDGARSLNRLAPDEVDAVFVLGNLAGQRTSRPYVISWRDGRPPAPHALLRTAQTALGQELGTQAGGDRVLAQWLRRALPLTLSEQGVLDPPAVLISASGERPPAHDEPIRLERFELFGRGVLRAVTAALEAPADGTAFAGADGVVTMGRLVPGWAARLLVGALLLPALVAALDAFFRVRRRGLPMARWSAWMLSFAVPFLVAWLWMRILDLTGVVVALPAPAAGGTVPLDTRGYVAMASAAVVFAGAAFGLRPLLLRRVGRRGDPAAGGAAAATGLLLAGLIGAVWLWNPYAAAVLLPASHAWLLASAPERRPPGPLAVLVVLAGLLGPLAVAAYYAQAWGLGPAEGLWTAFGLVSGGVLGVPDALVVSTFAAALCATVAVLRSRRRAAAAAPADEIVTRGPRTYAGPGSLGGTESALRR